MTLDELQYLRTNCTYFNPSYLRFLSSFRLQPTKQIKVTWTAIKDTGSAEDFGDLHLEVGGLWLHTILYEVPLLALISEAYFKFCDKDWNHDGQEEKAYNKGLQLLEHGCMFSEFGTRRRRDYRTHDIVMQGLTRAFSTAKEKGWQGKLTGTSNVHMAMKYGVPPVGTVAHEWFMGIASITNDYVHANEIALRYWVGCFGEGVLGIALTDTFGTPTFLKAFKKSLPTKAEAELNTAATQLPGAPRPAIELADGVVDVHSTTNAPITTQESNPSSQPSYAQTFTGVRQDSGNPRDFVKLMRDFYTNENITDKKTIVFSDSLNISLCFEYKAVAEEAGFNPTFGIGTFLTSKPLPLSPSPPYLQNPPNLSPLPTDDFTTTTNAQPQKSQPLNIVIKLSSANGQPAVKISDNIGKNTGDSDTVSKVKQTLGYVEKEWAEGDERRRWGDGK